MNRLMNVLFLLKMLYMEILIYGIIFLEFIKMNMFVSKKEGIWYSYSFKCEIIWFLRFDETKNEKNMMKET